MEGGASVSLYLLCLCWTMTALSSPTIITHRYVPERADSVGLMEAEMEMVGVDGVSHHRELNILPFSD